jgi:hypothetical protein
MSQDLEVSGELLRAGEWMTGSLLVASRDRRVDTQTPSTSAAPRASSGLKSVLTVLRPLSPPIK